jgi:hypothetical protein
MSNRLDQEREEKLQPMRMEYAIQKLTGLGFEVDKLSETAIAFEHKGAMVTFYPYSGWATGKSIKDGRGIDNLLKQLKA